MSKAKQTFLFVAAALVAAFSVIGVGSVISACSAQQASGAADAAKITAPLLPVGAGTAVTLGADVLQTAIAEYMAAHPDVPADQPLDAKAWAAILLSGLFGGGLRRTVTDFVAKHLTKPPNAPLG